MKVEMMKERVKSLFRYKDLLAQLVSRDIKLKYRRSFLGYLWSVLNPLMTMAVMSVVFSQMFKKGIENYPVYLLSGNILYSFMRESTTHGLTSITGNASLLKKTYVPKYIFTLSKVTSDLVNLGFSFCALLVVMLVTRVQFYFTIFLCLIPVIELYFFTLGLSLFLAQASVFFRDVQYIWGPVVLAWMYLTPLLYPIDALPPKLGWIVSHLNPLYYYVQPFRQAVMYAQLPDWTLVWRGALIAVVMLIIGLWSFAKAKDKFILHI